MTVAPIPAQPFSFDTEFDATGNVVRAAAWPPVQRGDSPAQLRARTRR